MSDRLAISAAFSVFMMSALVLFGPGAPSVEMSPASLRAGSAIAPATSLLPSQSVSAVVSALVSLD